MGGVGKGLFFGGGGVKKKGGGIVEKRGSPLFDAWLAGVPEGQKCAKGYKRRGSKAHQRRGKIKAIFQSVCRCAV